MKILLDTNILIAASRYPNGLSRGEAGPVRIMGRADERHYAELEIIIENAHRRGRSPLRPV